MTFNSPKIVGVLDFVDEELAEGVCPKCGSPLWIVDGDGEGKFWLLCVGISDNPGCVETKDLPANLKVETDDYRRIESAE